MKVYEVASGLYISGRFEDETELESTGIHFDVVVNLWHKPDAISLKPVGKRMYIHWPMRDGRIKEQRAFIIPLAHMIRYLLLEGKRVLIHCYGGRNRSAFIAGLVIKINELETELAYKTQIVEHIRSIRRSALKNQEFVAALEA